MGGGGREDCHKIDNRRSNRSCNAVREYKLRLIFDYINVVDDTCYGSSIENIYIFDRKIIFFFFFFKKTTDISKYRDPTLDKRLNPCISRSFEF